MAHRWLTVNCKIINGVLFYLFFLLCTTIRPKIKVFINLFILFLHNHSTKIRGHSNSFFFLDCVKILFASFVYGNTALIFRRLYLRLHESFSRYSDRTQNKFGLMKDTVKREAQNFHFIT